MANKKSEIRIYPSFTEVREDVQVTSPFLVYLPQDVYNQIMPGSLSLEGVNVLSMNAVLKENNLDGKVLHVHKEKEIREVKVIRGRDLLVQDVKTNRFYHVGRDQIEYNEVPEETGTEILFVLDRAGDAVLSYLMYGINWKPRYSFHIEKDKYDFQGWADITNNTPREYTVDKTELFGGDVALERHRPRFRGAEVAYCMAVADAPMARSAPSIRSEGEMSGLYMYSIGDKYILSPRSTFSLPFVHPQLTLEKIASVSTYFNETNSKGKFTRVYKISSNQFLPTGTVTVREDGRVVGQATIPDLSVDEPHELSVGNDPDVSYEREVKTLLVNKDSAKYTINIKINNNKARDIKVEFNENVGGRNEITDQDPKTLKIENNSIKYEATIPAKGNSSINYTIQFFYN